MRNRCLMGLVIGLLVGSTGILVADESRDADLQSSIARAEKMAQTVEICRDEFGVPHVYGPTDASVVFGFTYARAEDEFDKIQRSLLSATGRMSELMGAAAFMSDRAIKFFEIPTHAKSEYENLEPAFRDILNAYADALNYFVYKNPDTQPVVIRHFEPWHALAAGRTMNIAMLTLSPEYADLMKAAQNIEPSRQELEKPKPEDERDGSNMWALGPNRTESGNAMLFINPHIPLNQLYEGHLCSEEGLNVTGGFAYGSFLFPFAGHNEKLGWSLTVNYPDIIDVYIEEFSNPDDQNLYRYDEQWKEAVTWKDEIVIKQHSGQLKATELTCEKTVHGPVFFRSGNKGYSIAAAKVVEGGLPRQLYAMAKSQNLQQFQAAVGRNSLSFHNIMYADVEGNTWYAYNCATPKRNPDLKWDKPVSGAVSATQWNGYHSLDELPQVLNPKCGWMQNCNSSPFSTSADGQNPRREDFPSYIGRDDKDNNRVRISQAILSREKKFTFADLEAAAWDTRVLEADKWVPFLIEAIEAEQDERLVKVSETLGQWDRQVTVDSVAATLFHHWYERAVPLIRQNHVTNSVAIKKMVEVVNALETDFQTWEIAYGDLFRHQRPNADGQYAGDAGESFAIAGGHPHVGMVFTFLSRKVPGSKKRYGFHGHSFVSVIEFDPNGIKSKSLVPFGQSGDPNSKHYLDQAPLYAAGQFKPAYFSKAELEEHITRRYHPGE